MQHDHFHHDPPRPSPEAELRWGRWGMRPCCEICRYGELYPAPKGSRPAVPELPDLKDKGGMLAHTIFNSYLIKLRFWDALDEPWRRAENNVQCRRFPEFIMRGKGDVCGEFAEDPLGPVSVGENRA